MKKVILNILFIVFIFISCSRSGGSSFPPQSTGALPVAILQTCEHPIWFQLTENGPVHIESIEDAVMTAAFIPWALALHVRFYHERNGELVLAINRDGFVKIAPSDTGLAFYHFSGGEFWKHYTIGGFFVFNNQDTALLYLDERFLDSDAPLPNPRTWTFGMESNLPFTNSIPALELFPAQDGWNADTLRLGNDGYWYYRVSRKNFLQPVIQMLKTENLAQAGIAISIDDFFNSSPKEVKITDTSLPSLPEGFVYTGLAHVGDSLFASWEEQDTFNIGAAGFMLIKKTTPP
jgi:hypothetical protein